MIDKPIIKTVDAAIPYAAGGLIMYAFLSDKKEALLEAIFWAGLANQLYDKINEQKRRRL